MENNDPTTWYKESGLIAQEIYYDAPELTHLVHRGKPELDEEGNSIPLRPIHLLRDSLLRDLGARFGGRHFSHRINLRDSSRG